MVGGVNDAIVRHDGEIIGALGPPKSNLAASVGITDGGSPNITGQVSLHGGDGVGISRESNGQIIAYVVGKPAYNATGIGDRPDLRRNSGLLLRGENQTTL